MNCSKYKEIVYRIIDEKKNHPTAEMVFDDLKPDWPKLSLARSTGISASWWRRIASARSPYRAVAVISTRP